MQTFLKCSIWLSVLVIGLIRVLSAQPFSRSQENSSWVGEFYSNYRLDPVSNRSQPSIADRWNHLVLEKYARPSTASDSFSLTRDNSSSFWSEILLELIKNEDVIAYTDTELQEELSLMERQTLLHQLDTFRSFDHPGEEFIVEEELSVEKLMGIRVRERLSYSPKFRQLEYQAFAFAPLALVRNEDIEDMEIVPLCWYPVRSANKPGELLLNDDVVYVAETRHREPAVRLEAIKSLRGEFDQRQFFQQIIEHENLMIYSAEDHRLLAPEERLATAKPRTEMHPYLDPVTYEVTLPPDDDFILLEEFKAFQLLVRWFWDQDKKQLSFAFQGYAPLRLIENEQGDILYSLPFFYVK